MAQTSLRQRRSLRRAPRGVAVIGLANTRDGIPLAITIPGTGTYYYHYDVAGNVDRVTNGSGTTAVQFQYDALANVVGETHGPSWTSHLTINPFRMFGAASALWSDELHIVELASTPYDPGLGVALTRLALGTYRPCWIAAACDTVAEMATFQSRPPLLPSAPNVSRVTTSADEDPTDILSDCDVHAVIETDSSLFLGSRTDFKGWGHIGCSIVGDPQPDILGIKFSWSVALWNAWPPHPGWKNNVCVNDTPQRTHHCRRRLCTASLLLLP